MDRIAQKARANKESIYRHFGTKDELPRRVLDRFLDERGEQLLPRSQDVDAYAAALFRYFVTHPEFLRKYVDLGSTGLRVSRIVSG